MKPMGLTSTPFLSYHEINVTETDLFEDAWGLISDFCDVVEYLGQVETDPGTHLTARLIELISKQD